MFFGRNKALSFVYFVFVFCLSHLFLSVYITKVLINGC